MIYLHDFRLRLIDLDDINFTLDLHNDETVIASNISFTFLNSIQQETWIKSINSQSKNLYFIFEKQEETTSTKNYNNNTDIKWTKIGLAKALNIDKDNRSMGIGLSIAPQFRGQQLSKICLQLLFKLAFTIYGLNKIWLEVLANNQKALSLYTKCGFVKSGIHRQAVYKNNEYIDLIYMDLLYDEIK